MVDNINKQEVLLTIKHDAALKFERWRNGLLLLNCYLNILSVVLC
jgi:hypothetical protein